MSKYIAVLGSDGVLTGREEVADDYEGGIDPGDTPVDGSHKWDGSKFVPFTKRIGVLSDAGVLIGAIDVPGNVDGVDPGDLPTDGRYKWDADSRSWMPLGHGFGKVKTGNPPASFEAALLSIIVAMGDDAPADARSWAEWYGSDIAIRERESNDARIIRRRAGQ